MFEELYKNIRWNDIDLDEKTLRESDISGKR